MARGGSRQGQTGANYSNRTDLLSNRAPTAPPQAPAPSLAPQAQPQQNVPPAPGSLGTFGPTQRPTEPVTAGLPNSPGPGPEVMQPAFTPDPLIQAAAAFSAIPAVHQTPMMRALAAATQASAANASAPGVAAGAP